MGNEQLIIDRADIKSAAGIDVEILLLCYYHDPRQCDSETIFKGLTLNLIPPGLKMFGEHLRGHREAGGLITSTFLDLTLSHMGVGADSAQQTFWTS